MLSTIPCWLNIKSHCFVIAVKILGHSNPEKQLATIRRVTKRNGHFIGLYRGRTRKKMPYIGRTFLRLKISIKSNIFTWCGRKVTILATLCTNRQCYCLPLHMAVRLCPTVDSLQILTCYSCYAIVESVWSEVVFVRYFRKMDRQKFEQRCTIKVCVKLGESATVTYEKLQRSYGEHSLSRAQVFRWHKSFLEGR